MAHLFIRLPKATDTSVEPLAVATSEGHVHAEYQHVISLHPAGARSTTAGRFSGEQSIDFR